MRFLLTAGRANDAKGADLLLEGVQTEHVIADKGYYTEKVLGKVKELGRFCCNPAQIQPQDAKRVRSRAIQRAQPPIERAFNKLKRLRRIAARYGRKAVYFKSFLYLAASLMWL